MNCTFRIGANKGITSTMEIIIIDSAGMRPTRLKNYCLYLTPLLPTHLTEFQWECKQLFFHLINIKIIPNNKYILSIFDSNVNNFFQHFFRTIS